MKIVRLGFKKTIMATGLIFILGSLSGCNFLTLEDEARGLNKPKYPFEKLDLEKEKEAEKKINKKRASSLKKQSNIKQSDNLNNKEKIMIEIEEKNMAVANKYKNATIKTNQGDIEIEFFNDTTPIAVGNFIRLAEDDFYNNTKFHRVIRNFMIQGGDPNSKDDDWSNDGQGGPGYSFRDEFESAEPLVKGSLAMANAGPNTNGSQFFIVTADATPHLDGKHTNFGKVIKGMDIVNLIEKVRTNENDHPTEDIIIEGVDLK